METYLPPIAVLTVLSLVDERRWGLRGRIVAHVAKESARWGPGDFIPLHRRQLAEKIGASDGGVAKAVAGLETELVIELHHRRGRAGARARLQGNVARWRGVPWTIPAEDALWTIGEALRAESMARSYSAPFAELMARSYSAPLPPEMARSYSAPFDAPDGPPGGSREAEWRAIGARKQAFEWRAQERAIPDANGALARDAYTSSSVFREREREEEPLSVGGDAIARALLRAVPGGFVAPSQRARLEALIAAGLDVEWAVHYVDADARRGMAGVPALIKNLEDQAEARLETVRRETERRSAEEAAARVRREERERPQWRPPEGFTAPLRRNGHNGGSAEEES